MTTTNVIYKDENKKGTSIALFPTPFQGKVEPCSYKEIGFFCPTISFKMTGVNIDGELITINVIAPTKLTDPIKNTLTRCNKQISIQGEISIGHTGYNCLAKSITVLPN